MTPLASAHAPKQPATALDADSVDTSKPHWWRRLAETDPISLEPLRRLRYEPFGLHKDESHQCWFDGKVLAHYLVSTGVFIHPISRRELTRADCEALDAHILKNKLGKASVCYAFDHMEDYKKKDSPENQVLRLQEEASELLRSLYSGSFESSRPSRGREARDQREAISVLDDDFLESVPLGGANLESTEDFPTLDGAPSAAPSAPLTSNWRGSEVLRPVVPPPGATAPQQEAFPALSAADAFPSLSATTSRPVMPAGRWGSSATTAAASSEAQRLSHPVPPSSRTMSVASAPTRAAPSMTADDFPSLGSSTAVPGSVPNRGTGWAQPAASIVAKPPVPTSCMQSGTAAPPAPPPSFEAMAHEFPALGVATTPAAAKGAGKRAPPANREELVMRNKALMASLSQVAAELGKPDAMMEFKKSSLAFQRGDLSCPVYLNAFRHSFGDVASRLYFSELLLLLPDEGKREELQRCYESFIRAMAPSSAPPANASSQWAKTATQSQRPW